MCVLFRIMCICCKQEEKASGANDNTLRTEAQRLPPVTVPPRPPRPRVSNDVLPTPVYTSSPELSNPPNDECFLEGEGASSRSELPQQENSPNKTSPLPQQKYPKLQDYGSSEDLKQLTIKEMKILLAMNRVDFKGCIEKSDLLEKLNRLWKDSNQNKDIPENIPTEELCKLCMDAPLDCVLLECGHIASCVECGKKLAECPICRQYVVRVVRTFKA